MTAPTVEPGRSERVSPPPLVPDLEAAGAFLDAWVALTGAQHVTLVRIVPDKDDCKGRAFHWPEHRDAALRWIAASNARANVYFSVNTARPINKKPTKADIETLVAVHVDLDPRKGRNFATERKRVLAIAAELAERPDPPTFILDSGGGVQAFYIATDPAAAEPEYVDEIEDLNHRLGAALGDDGTTWNADRIMRAPGTVNHPNQLKVANGQPPALARVLSSTGELRSWRDILAAIARLEDEPPEHAEPAQRGDRRKGNGHDQQDLGGDLPPYATEEQLDELFSKLPHLAAVWDKSTCTPPFDDSPSGWDQRFASALAHEGYEPEMIASYLRSYREHHESNKNKQNRRDYIWRTIARATRDRAPETDEHPAEEPINKATGQNGSRKGNEHAAGDGQQQTAGDSQGKNRGTFHTGAKPGADWPEPGTLGEPPAAPAFPVDLLPRELRQWVIIQADNMGVPPCVLAVPALVSIAGAVGKDAVLQVKRNDPSWTERPCLWGAVIMPKGSLKSPAIRAATAPLRMAEARARERWQETVKAWEARQERTKGGQIKPNPNDPKPPEPKLVMTDATVEAMADAMVESRGLTLIRDELSGLVANMSRYNKGSDRPFLLECHAGGPYAVDRILRGRQIVPDVYLSIIGGIQPKVARRAFSASAGGEDDGFLERFGLISYPDPIPWAGVKDEAPERDWRQMVGDAVLRLSSKTWPDHLEKADGFLRFHHDAQARFFDWLEHHMRNRVRAPGADDRPDHGFMSKGQGLVLRLAITIHLFRHSCGEDVDLAYLDVDTIEASVGIFERFCCPTYRRVCAAFGEGAAFDGAKRIADLIVRRKMDKIRVGDVTKLAWQGLRERKPIEAAFEALEDIDWLRKPASMTGPRGGRPPDHWLVNPKVHQVPEHAE